MNLLAILTRSEKEQESAQVKRTVASVEMAQQSVVNGYKKDVINLEGQLEDHLDVTVKKIGDGEQWCKKLQEIKISLEIAKKNLTIAEATYSELFS